jgi:hypothetical protein
VPEANTTLVACKLPHGLWIDNRDPKTGVVLERFRLNGARFRTKPKTGLPNRKFTMLNEEIGDRGTFGLTRVPTSIWERFAAENADFPPLAKGMIFASTTPDHAEGFARDVGKEPAFQTGLEPLDGDKPGPKLARISPNEEE